MAVTVSTVLGPRWMASNRHEIVARIKPDQTRPDQIRSLQLPVEITPGVKEVSPRVCPGIFPMFQSRPSDREWEPDKLERRWGGGELWEESRRENGSGKDQQSRAE